LAGRCSRDRLTLVCCAAPLGQTEELLPRLALVSGLQHMLRIQLDAQEAAARLEEERRKALEQAAALALEQRVHRYRLAVIEDYLVLRCPRCPRCLKAFADYAGCDALSCGNCGCGFCALCLQGQSVHTLMISANQALHSPRGP
jgi:hypothetical protein